MTDFDSDASGVTSKLLTTADNRPGSLRGDSWITLQTRQAQRLVSGRKSSDEKHAIIGLTRFGALTSIPYVCARLDDPYADWWLVRIEEALEYSFEEVTSLYQKAQLLLNAEPGMHVGLAESLHPIRIPLLFSNPYAYIGARLLIKFDVLARAVLTARHHGFLDRNDAEKKLHLGGRAVRRALNSPLGYKNQSTNRNDIKENNARAQKAREFMGVVPEEIINRTRRARHAPETLSATASGFHGDNSLFRNKRLPLGKPSKPTTTSNNKEPESSV